MNTCKTCKWWTHAPDGCCDFIDTTHAEKAAKIGKRFEIVASADDDSNLQAVLHTGPDFGCVHHEPLQAGNPTNGHP